MPTPPRSLIKLARKWPARAPDLEHLGCEHFQGDMAALLNENLALASEAYRLTGTWFGDQGKYWQVYLEIEKLRGHSFADSVQEMSAEERELSAVWALENKHRAFGLEAYAAYLAAPGDVGTSEVHNSLYIDALAAVGRHDEAAAMVDRLSADEADRPEEQCRLCLAMAARGDSERALARLEPVRRRYHDDPNVWAVAAVLHTKLGDKQAARTALKEAAKHNLLDEQLLRTLMKSTELNRWAWRRLKAKYGTPDLDDAAERLARPGARPRLTTGPSPHHFGGDDFQMPPCRGCGHPIRQWFALDIREIEPLRTRLPDWKLFPLLGCADCGVWMGRHDYRLIGSSIELVNVAILASDYTEVYETMPPIPKQPVALDWSEPIEIEPGEDAFDILCDEDHLPQVGGAPHWVQQPRRVWCWNCREEMCFVAGMATTEELQPIVPINNECGYQYHFACGPCGAISVIPQWS